MSGHESLVDKLTDELVANHCASIIIASPFFGDDIYFRIKTDSDKKFESLDIENLIHATKEVLRILEKELNDNEN